jgi:hypothetical protein
VVLGETRTDSFEAITTAIPEEVGRFPYRPTAKVDSIADLVELV